jgi:molecular chaperone GrpE
MDEIVKNELTARFRAYLDAELEEADGNLGKDDEKVPDLFTLLAEVAALNNEVKLESRQIKSALDEFRTLFDTLREANQRLAEEQDRRGEQDRAAAQESQKDLILALLEVRDRLQAGHEQALHFRPGWLKRRAAADFVASMAEGMAMNLRRFDEILARQGVRALQALGQPFDPRTMHAAELASDPGSPTGLVVGELRKGFAQEERLLRPAEVVVNRPREG